MDLRSQVLKRVWKMTIFGAEIRSGLYFENRAAHPHEEFPGVPHRFCWFSHDDTKFQTKLSILPRFYFHDVLEQLKNNFHTNFRFRWVLGFVLEYA